jgi:hypothetical protein
MPVCMRKVAGNPLPCAHPTARRPLLISLLRHNRVHQHRQHTLIFNRNSPISHVELPSQIPYRRVPIIPNNHKPQSPFNSTRQGLEKESWLFSTSQEFVRKLLMFSAPECGSGPRSPVERATAEATAERTLQAYGILVSVCGWVWECGKAKC